MAISGNDISFPNRHGEESYLSSSLHTVVCRQTCLYCTQIAPRPLPCPLPLLPPPPLGACGVSPQPQDLTTPTATEWSKAEEGCWDGGGAALGVVKDRQTNVRILDLGCPGSVWGRVGWGEGGQGKTGQSRVKDEEAA